MENSTMLEYERFLESKRHIPQNFGIDPLWIPDTMKPYQAYTADRLIRKGRGAGYLDTGMGKTFIELVIAANYLRAHNKRVLILTPIAVAFQFLKEVYNRFSGDKQMELFEVGGSEDWISM